MDTTNSDAALGIPGQPGSFGNAFSPTGSQWGEVNDLLVQLRPETESKTPSSAATEETATSAPLIHASSEANQLIQVRLGIASGLFAALRAKDAATAAHSYRVAIYCSTWAKRRGLKGVHRDALEVASLLHDVGKIGVPDNVLLKPSALWVDEALVMDRHQTIGLEILRSCCSCESVLDIVTHASTWYDGSHGKADRAGVELPLGARMLSIANAFDAMTTDQVYRRAMSHEVAIAELFHCSGTQFDPHLVQDFAELTAWGIDKLAREVERDWLTALNPAHVNELWQLRAGEMSPTAEEQDAPFRQLLPDQLTDAVIFIDKDLRVLLWNHGAETLTGVAGTSMRGRHWQPAAIAMLDAKRAPIDDKDCPVSHAILTGQPWVRRVQIKGRGRRRLTVDAHVTPVTRPDGQVDGATLVMHDVSPEISLEARCQNLHELASKDPLTEVANRAEFDRVLAMFVVVHLEQNRPCSMIMSDIDHFKRVNDTFGHQAGDEVLKFVARVFRNSCRPGDLVARYGGEELVVLCADCDNMAATRRAEEIRGKIAAKPHSVLCNEPVTISCGVTEIQPGDTPATMLRRADRAMYLAKDQGRNSVVQLGTGLATATADCDPHVAETPQSAADIQTPTSCISDAAPEVPYLLAVAELEAWIPPAIAVQKLQGFAADHFAEVLFQTPDNLQLRMGTDEATATGTATDYPVPLKIDLRLSEEQAPTETALHAIRPIVMRTRIRVAIRAIDKQPQRQPEAILAARQLVDSLKSYLVAHEAPASH